MSGINWSAFEDYAAARMEEKQIPGLAIAVSRHGNVIYEKGFGIRDLKTSEPVTPDTLIGVGSVTKSFTAMAIMKLAGEKKLSLDDPVVKHLPEFTLRGLEDPESVKIIHLLTHTTGLPPMLRREELNQFDEHLSYIANAEYELLGKPGEYFSYCNDTFLLLGAIIERLTGRLYRRYVTDSILEPLQMHRSTFNLEEVAKYKNVSVPYIKNSQTKSLEEVPWPRIGNYEVGGGLRSNVRDLLRYGQVFVGESAGLYRFDVSKDSLAEMWQPVHQTDRNGYYGLALDIIPDYSGVTLIGHSGGMYGVSAHFGFVPEEGIVAAVLMNVYGISADEIWLAAVNTALGFPLEQKSAVEPVYEAALEELERLVGTYTSAEGGYLRIYLEDGKPKADWEGKYFELRASDNRTLVTQKSEYPIRFFFRDEDNAWAALAGMRMLTRI
ncbi:CubicO group peptidase (beta-lactamase class C family) [Paenibacillus forsythiae]|uniref:CubicO group peptidase (Beta-lactamase class C family) n=1 Tax=Paenibacillus forsythiae TaxID=365616 RepID=A0ABU3H2D1_9BACL|nr:serine hydrolase domain-containing protein [Paenibacillus forsythiae]MDT3424973.1 CubicO group peptidase (beta-lactamase class C family) [Paenibacillus forsythiae]